MADSTSVSKGRREVPEESYPEDAKEEVLGSGRHMGCMRILRIEHGNTRIMRDEAFPSRAAEYCLAGGE